MKVVILGAGNLATRLSLEMHRKGMRIAQVFSQTETSAKALAKRLGAMPITDLSAVDTDADLYIFALKDSILKSVLTQMNTTSGLWVHTAGSIPMELLTQYHDRCGVLYPLQSFSKTREVDFAVIPVFIEAQHAEDLKMLKKISGALTERVVELSSEKRKKLH
ncbi:MAG: NAD(P)-binding domain-containing protein, partial [Tannerellaceae bacterium]